MSDELIEAEMAPVPVAKKKLNLASVLGLLLLFAACAFGLYIGSIWQGHYSRTGKLKAKNGDFVQLEHRGDVDEFAPQQRRGPRGGEEGGEGAKEDEADKKPAEPNWYDKYLTELFPKPIQVVYWRDPSLTAEDIDMLLQFSDLEILSVNCEAIDSPAVKKLLTLPKLRRLNVQAAQLDASGIADWKADAKFRNLSLVNPNWKGADIEKLLQEAEENKSLKDKVSAASSARPSFGGA